MNHPGHDRAYRSAMSAAVDDLRSINEEIVFIGNRMHQLDSALEALKPFLHASEQTAAEYRRPTSEPIASADELVHVIESTPQETAIPDAMPKEIIESADPIQRRINSVLGLAVA